MDIERWLGQARVLDQQIDDALVEKARLFALATDISPKPPDGMPFSNSGTPSQKMQNAVSDLIDLTKEIDRLIDLYIAKRQEIIAVLQSLPQKEYSVLYRYYIYKDKKSHKRMTWEQVAEDLGYCTVQVWRIKKNGLKILQDVIECNAQNDYNGIVK